MMNEYCVDMPLDRIQAACNELRALQHWFGFTHFLADKPAREMNISHEERYSGLSEPSVRSYRLSAATPEFIEGLAKLLEEEHARCAARIAELEARMAGWE